MKNPKSLLPLIGTAGMLIGGVPKLLAQDVPGSWYLGLDTGVALQQNIRYEGVPRPERTFAPGFRLDLAGGVQLARCFKAELELGIIFNSISSVGGDCMVQVPMMLNGIYTLPLPGRFSAYAGAGVGGVPGMLWNSFLSTEDSFAFGYQAIVGAKYAINDALDLGLSYKFLGTLEHNMGDFKVGGTYSHCILAAFTFRF